MSSEVDPNKPVDLLSFHVGQTIIIIDPTHPGFNQRVIIAELTTTGVLIKDTDGHYIHLERSQITHFGEILI